MAVVDPGTVYLVFAAIILFVIGVVSLFCKDNGNDKRRAERAQGPQAVARPRAENAPPGVRRRGNRRPRGMVVVDDSDEDEPAGGEDDSIMDEIEEQEGKIGAKKLRKLQDKAEKKRQREIELQEREEKKERERKLEELRKKQEEKRKAEEAAEAEEARLRKEEEERKEHEEYLKLKEAFTVDEEGESEQAGDLNSQSLLQEFINHIKEMKVVMLEDLAAHFKLKTQECIQRVQDLQSNGKLTGVIDDRGKFIYITVEELESVAKFIRQHGRVSITELAESSNRLINLNPDNSEIQKKLIVGDSLEVGEVAS